MHRVHLNISRQDVSRDNTILCMVLHQIYNGKKVGYIVSCLSGEKGPHLPIIFLASTSANCLIYIPAPSVVSRKSKVPIVVNSIKLLQVIAGGFCAPLGVLPFVNIAVYSQPFSFGCIVHELPQAARARWRSRFGI